MNLRTEIAPKLAEQYADMLSLDFRRRNTLLNSWHHFTDDLLQWDKRLQAYIDGLKLLSKEGSLYFNGWSDSLLSRGDIFALGTFAFHTEDSRLLESCFSLMLAMPHLTRVAESVIAWAPSGSSLWEMAFSSPIIRVMAGHIRNDLPPCAALQDDEISRVINSSAAIPGLINTLHRQQHPDYLSIVAKLAAGEDPLIRLGTLAALLTCHLPYSDISPQDLLMKLSGSSNEMVRNQAAMLYLCNTNFPSSEYLSWLRENNSDKRLYIKSLGYSGMPENINILKEFLDDPVYARLAAVAIVMITGASPESASWKCQMPPLDSDLSDDDSDSALSWPEKPAFERWWKTHAIQFEPTGVYVAGHPATKEGLQNALQYGCLALHPLAKSRLCHLTRDLINEYYGPLHSGK